MGKKINLLALVAAFRAAATAEKVDEVFAVVQKLPFKQRSKVIKPLSLVFTNALYADKMNDMGLRMLSNRVKVLESLGADQKDLRDYISASGSGWVKQKFQLYTAEHIHKAAGKKAHAALRALVEEAKNILPEERDTELGWLKFTLRFQTRLNDIPPPPPVKVKNKADL